MLNTKWAKKLTLFLSSLAGKQPSSEHAAVWVPDNEANSCMNCKKSQFTVINRRVSVLSLNQHSSFLPSSKQS